MTIPRLSEYPLPGTDELPAPALNWTFDPDRAVLLIHDMQRYFLDFYPAGFADLVDNIARLKALGLPTVYTAQPPRQPAKSRGLLTDRWGPGLQDRAEIVAELEPGPADVVLTKHRYSAFHRSDLADRLVDQGRDQLVITGVYAHIGITATALDAFAHDIAPFVVADAIGDFTRRRHIDALGHLANTCAVVTVTAGLTGTPAMHTIRGRIHAELGDTVGDDDPLLEAGLEPARLERLLTDWRAEGARIDSSAIGSVPTIRRIHRAVVTSR